MSKLLGPNELFGLYSNELDALVELQATGTPRGPKTGLKALDKIIGYMRPELYVIHGAPGSGKSALSWQIACDCGVPAIYLSCEMSPLDMIHRHVAHQTRKPKRTLLQTPSSYPLEEERAMARVAALENCPYVLDGTAEAVLVAELGHWLMDIRVLHRARSMLCVIDSLQVWAGAIAAANSDGATEYTAVNEALARLEALAALTNTTFVVLSERSREHMDKGSMNAGKGSGRIEYSAGTVMAMQRDKEEQAAIDAHKFEPSGAGDHYDLQVNKNRHGIAAQSSRLIFKGDTMTFTEQDSVMSLGRYPVGR